MSSNIHTREIDAARAKMFAAIDDVLVITAAAASADAKLVYAAVREALGPHNKPDVSIVDIVQDLVDQHRQLTARVDMLESTAPREFSFLIDDGSRMTVVASTVHEAMTIVEQRTGRKAVYAVPF